MNCEVTGLLFGEPGSSTSGARSALVERELLGKPWVKRKYRASETEMESHLVTRPVDTSAPAAVHVSCAMA
jgi:hypothetical protein